MRAIYCPGPSYFDQDVKQVAGWWHILAVQKQALEDCGFEVTVLQPVLPVYEPDPPIAKYLTYGLPHAAVIQEVDLIVGAPAYAFLPFLYGRQAKKISYVWNTASWRRREQLENEYKYFGAAFPEQPSSECLNTRALELSDHVISCSPFVKKTHGHLLSAELISIAFWGVDSQRFHPAKREPDVFRVLFVGGDPVRKGLWYLIQALQDADQVLQPYELWVVGCAPIKDAPAHWRQFGMVPHADMPQIYQQCSVLCLPTLEDGIALCVQEAMASGLPVITSPETSEVFENLVSGLTVGYRDIDGIAHYLRALRANPEHRRQTAAAARALAETQSWYQTADDFKEIIQRVMRGGPLPFESAMPWLKGGAVGPLG